MPQQKRPEDEIKEGAQELMTRGSWAGRLASLLGRASAAPVAQAQPAQSQFQDLPESKYPRSYSPMQRDYLLGLPGAQRPGLVPDIQAGERYEKESYDWRQRNALKR